MSQCILEMCGDIILSKLCSHHKEDILHVRFCRVTPVTVTCPGCFESTLVAS